ncbi:MAG: hypothetical protein A3J74_08695 [Elusimicrobia bacterium RIFCSPHIGHO2_02_FULL_57_9]|nr:MAG: hypothetical protein A3J74_08695 [Elusimicrobia bacterium RIFCSPHIGHO2_02_FULL_57_9]
MATKVLVVDDEEDYRLIVRDVLSAAGIEVLAVSNGEEALVALKNFSPDLALVDWMMPRMDGEGFCRALRSLDEFKDIPILMFTVKAKSDDELEALHFGVDDYITKPFNPEELLARVRAALRRCGVGG